MNREMCQDCPFRMDYREEWAAACLEDMIRDGQPLDGSIVHGCHNIVDSETTDPEKVCVGHVAWLKLRYSSS